MIIQLVVVERENGPVGHIRVGGSLSPPFRSKEHAIDTLLMLSKHELLTEKEQLILWYAIHGSSLPEQEDHVGTIIASPLSEVQYIEIVVGNLSLILEKDGYDPSLN